MNKLFKDIEEFNKWRTTPSVVGLTLGKEIKELIAIMLEEERNRIAKIMRDEIIRYIKEAKMNPKSNNYLYAENVPLDRLDNIINLIKEDK